jgi:glutaredoxin
MEQATIWLYTLSTCSTCRRVERLLQRAGRPYEVVAVDRLDEDQKTLIVDMLRQLNPRLTFPTLVAGETVIAGYRETEILEALGTPRRSLQRRFFKWFGK